ncbi:MAG: hypothetical protein AABX28_02075 [Nanoarchaeota archaeon]
MKPTTKQKIWKATKIIWFAIGGILLLINLFWFVQMITDKTLFVLILAVFFGESFFALILYLSITALFLLIKGVIKILRKNVI